MLSCAICGRTDVKISKQRGICLECARKEGFIKSIKPIKLTICPICYGIRRERWISVNNFSEIEHLVEKTVRKKIILRENTKINRLQLSLDPSLESAKINLELYLEEFEENFDINIKTQIDLFKSICENCLMKKTQNYQALIQLRTRDEKIIKEFDRFLESLPNEEFKFFIKKERFSYGIDAYFSNVGVTRKLANSFRKKYYCDYKETIEGGMRYTLLLDFKKTRRIQ